jgi:hypothetical protein
MNGKAEGTMSEWKERSLEAQSKIGGKEVNKEGKLY